ncbi:hypothetical protein LMANV2_350023 [Leptospira interrogans serovar Manilae]|uniref:Uncharacterized protein n=1 Tax=Leptospira interrogans serovar Manilae TaxID=214675 RepID=A0AAQ1SP56_LEPIR|nr:hypothetical protein LMANV2_350023 [Leptospira interrogans serovar Manilae]
MYFNHTFGFKTTLTIILKDQNKFYIYNFINCFIALRLERKTFFTFVKNIQTNLLIELI